MTDLGQQFGAATRFATSVAPEAVRTRHTDHGTALDFSVRMVYGITEVHCRLVSMPLCLDAIAVGRRPAKMQSDEEVRLQLRV
jgi:hypothetical protein